MMHVQSGQLNVQRQFSVAGKRGRKDTLQEQIMASMGPDAESDENEDLFARTDKNGKLFINCLFIKFLILVYQGRTQSNINLNPPINYLRKNTYDKSNIVRICLTGGPCAGKTTAIASIKQDLTQLGMKVLVVPEAATALMNGGAFIVSSGFT